MKINICLIFIFIYFHYVWKMDGVLLLGIACNEKINIINYQHFANHALYQ